MQCGLEGKKSRTNAKKKNRKLIPFKKFEPRNTKQEDLFNSLEQEDVVVVDSCAGTGKTFTVCAKAVELLLTNQVKQIVISRPPISTGKSNGSVPGTMEEKCIPFLNPVIYALKKQFFNVEDYNKKVKEGKIRIEALETIRGATFDNAFVYFDEAQQLTLDELEAVITRTGDNSVLCFTGDSLQNDLGYRSGLSSFCSLAQEYGFVGLKQIEFTENEVVRSDVCKRAVKMFNWDRKRKQEPKDK